jgi:hypothetical protein
MDSHQICESPFHFPKLANTNPQKECGDTDAQQETGQIKLASSSKDAPTKAVDDANDRV